MRFEAWAEVLASVASSTIHDFFYDNALEIEEERLIRISNEWFLKFCLKKGG